MDWRSATDCGKHGHLDLRREGQVRTLHHWALLGLLACTTGGALAAPPPPSEPIPVQTLPPATIDDTLQVEGEDVAAKEVRTRLLLDVAVNGKGPYRFVVDSGADSSAVGLAVAKALNLPVVDRATITSSTARETVERVQVESLAVGPNRVRNLRLPALPEKYLGGDGIIGIDALVRQRLKLDFEHRTVKVEDARKRPPHEPGEIVVTARRSRGQLILTQVEISKLSLQAVIDTGSEVTIGNEALRQKLKFLDLPEPIYAPVTGVTGVQLVVPMVIVPELRVGAIVLRNVPIAFADLPPFKLFGLDHRPALLLGADILELFRSVSLDFRARRVRFQLASCRSRPTDANPKMNAESARMGSIRNDLDCARSPSRP